MTYELSCEIGSVINVLLDSPHETLVQSVIVKLKHWPQILSGDSFIKVCIEWADLKNKCNNCNVINVCEADHLPPSHLFKVFP